MGDLQTSLNTIQAGTAAIAKDLDAIAEHQQRVAQALKQLAAKGAATKNELEALTTQAEAVAKDVIYTAQQAQQLAHPAHPGQGLPSTGTPGHDLPGGARPGHDLPSGARPDAGLPEPGHPSSGIPGTEHPSGQPVPPPSAQPKK